MVKLAAVLVLNVIQALGQGPVVEPMDLSGIGDPDPVPTHPVIMPTVTPLGATTTVPSDARSSPTALAVAGDSSTGGPRSDATRRIAVIDVARKSDANGGDADSNTPQSPPSDASDPQTVDLEDEDLDEIPDPIVLHHRGYSEPLAARAMRAANVQPYTLFYQTWDPQSLQTNRADPQAIINRWRRFFPPDTTAYLQLDYEYEFLEALRSDPSSDRFQDMLEHLCQVFDEVKAAFPNSKLTYYGLPHFSKFIKDNQGEQLAVWPIANEEERAVELARFEAIRPLLDRLDWFVPNLYDWKRNTTQAEKYGPETVERDFSWRTDVVRLTKEYVLASARPDRPVIPMVCVWYVFRGKETGPDRGLLIPMDEFIHDQVMPAIEGGADGIAFWNHDENVLDTAFRVITYPSEELVELRRHFVTERNGGRPFNWSDLSDRQVALDLFERQEALRIASALRTWREARSAAVGDSEAPVEQEEDPDGLPEPRQNTDDSNTRKHGGKNAQQWRPSSRLTIVKRSG